MAHIEMVAKILMIEDGICPLEDARSRKDISDSFLKMDPAFVRSTKRKYRKIRRKMCRAFPHLALRKDYVRSAMYNHYIERARILIVNNAKDGV